MGPLVATLWLTLASPAFHVRWQGWLLGPPGARPLAPSDLDLRCVGTPAAATVVCVADGDGRTGIWSIDPASGARRQVGWLAGSARPAGLDGPGRLVLRTDTGVALVDLDGGRVRRFRAPGPTWRVYDAAVADGRVATLASRNGATVLTLYDAR